MSMQSPFAWLALLAAAFSARAAPFINLDFESVNTNNIRVESTSPFVRGFGNPSDLLPSWTLESPRGGSVAGFGFNSAPPELSFTEPSFPAIVSREALRPNYTNYLTGNYAFGVVLTSIPLFVSQTGDIPVYATELNIFVAAGGAVNCFFCGDYMHVYLNGTEVPAVEKAFEPIVRCDISAFAGLKDVKFEMEIGAYHTQLIGDAGFVDMDRIEFAFPNPLPTTPRISQATITNRTNGFSFYWSADGASKYQVELATNIPAAWLPIGSPVTSTNGTFYFTDTSVTNQPSSQRFYRLRTVP